MIDFYPWGTAIIDPVRSVAVLILNSLEIPPPLIFSNQVFFQTLEILLHTRQLYPIHASVVARGRRAVLFPAESGAGKTTLALTLVQAGYRYLGDDKPLIAYRNGRPHVLAFPEPVNTYVDELRQFDHLPKRIHPEIPPEIPLKQSFYIEDYWPGSVINSAYHKAIVFPEPRLEKPSTPTLIEAVSPAEGLRRLVELNWPVRLPWGFNGFFDMMRDLAERTPCYTIRWGDSLEDVPGKIGELLDGRVEGPGDGMDTACRVHPMQSLPALPQQLIHQFDLIRPFQRIINPVAIFFFVPEEKTVLIPFFIGRTGGIHSLQCIGMIAGVINDRGHGHRRGGEILHLFQLKAQVLGLTGQIGHVFDLRARVAGNEVGDELLF